MNKCLYCDSATLNPKFCSKSCAAKRNNRGRVRSNESRLKTSKSLFACSTGRNYPVHECENCKKSFSKNNYSKYRFCSRSCSAILNKHSASLGGRISAHRRCLRSKDEVLLYDLILSEFSDAVPNFIIADGWDADIVIPSIRTAILWHGPWHRKEMGFKNHSLKQVQTRDRIKTELFEKLDWKVIVYHDDVYDPFSAFEHLIREVVGAL